MTLYEILGVAPNASQDDIKQAYRRAAAKHHPDRENGDTAKMQAVTKAYETLSDPERRAYYDQHGADMPPKPPTPEERAQQMMPALLNEALEGLDPDQDDLLEAMRKLVAKLLQEHQSKLDKFLQRRDKLHRAQRRLSARKGKVNHLHPATLALLNGLEVPINGLTEQVETLAALRGMLQDYQYEMSDEERMASARRTFDRAVSFQDLIGQAFRSA